MDVACMEQVVKTLGVQHDGYNALHTGFFDDPDAIVISLRR